jgi:large subunit ribosomal protein L7/L12
MSDEVKVDNANGVTAKVDVPAKFQSLVSEIEKMSITELAELVKVLEAKFGVSAAAPVMVAAGGAAAGPAEEKTSFNVELKEVGAQKIEVIKVVRDITAKGLKESKDLVDAAATAPQMVKEGVKKEEADEIAKKFAAAGAKVEIK